MRERQLARQSLGHRVCGATLLQCTDGTQQHLQEEPSSFSENTRDILAAWTMMSQHSSFKNVQDQPTADAFPGANAAPGTEASSPRRTGRTRHLPNRLVYDEIFNQLPCFFNLFFFTCHLCCFPAHVGVYSVVCR